MSGVLAAMLVACGGQEWVETQVEPGAGDDVVAEPGALGGAKVCATHCDGRDPALASGDERPVPPVGLGSGRVVLHLDDSSGMAWGSVESVGRGYKVWLDRSWDGGKSWSEGERLGVTSVPTKGTSWRTMLFNVHDPENKRRGVVRACGSKPGNNEIRCTAWARMEVCQTFCDGRDAALTKDARTVGTASLFGRTLSLQVDDANNLGFGTIEHGKEGDEVWLDRSWNGGRSWESGSMLGHVRTAPGATSARTAQFNFDEPRSRLAGGAMRACGKASGPNDVVCTPWARAAPSRAIAAASVLAWYYTPKESNFDDKYWWHSAQAVTALFDFAERTGSRDHLWMGKKTLEGSRRKHYGDFTNYFIDDTGWWGLAWVRGYDVTGDGAYLDAARKTADFMARSWDGRCGGGVYWSSRKDYKNAITNELYIKLNASLHNRIPGDTTYLDRAKAGWAWFKGSGMTNSEKMINDGLDDQCRNNGRPTWTYNQGVILGALVELHRATGDADYLTEAHALAQASTKRLTKEGVVAEFCDPNCGSDGTLFKGIYIRNLGELSRATGGTYAAFLSAQSDAIWSRNRNAMNQFGASWLGPIDTVDFIRQTTALDALIAATP